MKLKKVELTISALLIICCLTAEAKTPIKEKIDNFYNELLITNYKDIQNKKENATDAEKITMQVMLKQLTNFASEQRPFTYTYCSNLCTEYGVDQLVPKKSKGVKAESGSVVPECSQKCHDIEIQLMSFMKGVEAGTSTKSTSECTDAVDSTNRGNTKRPTFPKSSQDYSGTFSK